jgi:manganese efflux pump family protein
MFAAALRVALVAVSLALDVFAVSVGVGIRGVTRPAMLRIGLSFAFAEVAMNLVGAGLGAVAGRAIGGVAAYIGFTALIGVGIFMIVETFREGEAEGKGLDLSRGMGLFLASLSISLDSLGIGFSIVYIGVPLAVTLVAIAAASVISTFVGLGFGKSFGKAAGEYAGFVAGVVLILTGLGFAAAKYFHLG